MSKKKLAGIIVGCTIAIIVAIVLFIFKPWEGIPSLETYVLNTNVNPSGTGSISPPGGEYDSDVQVTLTASPASGYTFDHWSGSASGTTSTITITMDSEKSITANFKATTQAYTLTVNISPSGAGSVSPAGGEYESDMDVTLTAIPASGYVFDYWDGAASGSSSTVTITMNSNKAITAHFTASKGYSRGNPVGIGTPLSIWVGSSGVASHHTNDYEVRITLLQIIRGSEAWQRIYEANMFNDPPEPGFEYILAKLRFEYLTGPTPDTAYDVSPVWFDAVSSDGKEYDMASVIQPDPSIRTNLYPGASHEGWVSFHVAQSDAKPVMTFGRKYDGTGGIWFKLY
jgi:uncharacterized repeat protein (TIGR02543 family)